MPNIYDNEDFFNAYADMPRSRGGLAAAGEWRQLKPHFPDLNGKTVLDIGCGYGWHCKYAAEMGAAAVLGIDGSRKMIEKAGVLNAGENIEYKICAAHEYEYPENTFDLAVSNLVLHYIADLRSVYKNVYKTLKNGGCFLFNIEHPVFTSGINQDWIYDDDGNPMYWAIDNYYYSGERQTKFLGKCVKKQHHTLTQIINPLIEIGFRIMAVEEAKPPEDMMSLPEMKDELRRPMMLIIKAEKLI